MWSDDSAASATEPSEAKASKETSEGPRGPRQPIVKLKKKTAKPKIPKTKSTGFKTSNEGNEGNEGNMAMHRMHRPETDVEGELSKATDPSSSRHEPAGDVRSEEKDASKDDIGKLHQLHNEMLMLKAKTMYEMVEEVDVGTGSGTLRLLYLSNKQADSIASSPKALQKMLDALEIKQPKLVINLLSSWGLRASLNLYPEQEYNKNTETAGLQFNNPAFLDDEQEQRTRAQLDMFMADVILPLAAATNALIIANGITGDCALAGSLSRSFSLQRAKWAGAPPFTILSISPCTPILYYNKDKDSYWRMIQQGSTAWKTADKSMEERVQKHGYEGLDYERDKVKHDLEPNCTHLIVVDQLSDTKASFDKGPFLHLRTELIRFLSVDVPSLAMKTAWSVKMEQKDMSLQTALNQANAGWMPVWACRYQQKRPVDSISCLKWTITI